MNTGENSEIRGLTADELDEVTGAGGFVDTARPPVVPQAFDPYLYDWYPPTY